MTSLQRSQIYVTHRTYHMVQFAYIQRLCENQGLRGGGAGGTMTPGPIHVRGPITEPVGFKVPSRGPIEITLINEYLEG